MSVYGSCIENKDKYEALQTLYSYIDFVDKRNDLNENEKECILIGLNVAWHSFCNGNDRNSITNSTRNE